MNTPNPLVPQGSVLEQQAKGKPHLRIAIFIVAIHVVFLGGLLIQGCKKEEPKSAFTPSQPLATDPYLTPDTNASTYTPPVYTPATPLGGTGTDMVGTAPLPPGTGLPPIGATSAPPGGYFPDAIGTTPSLPTPSAGSTEHVVAPRDTYYSLAKKYGVSMKAITAANPGVDPNRLAVGKKLVIPAPAPRSDAGTGLSGGAAGASAVGGGKTYKIKPADNLSKIAAAHGVSVRDLMNANNLKTTHIRAGDTLVIPPPKGRAATAETAALTPLEPVPLLTPSPGLPASGVPGSPWSGGAVTNR